MSRSIIAATMISLIAMSAQAETRRECDLPMTYNYVRPELNVPLKYQHLLGLWTGEVRFGAHTMCIAVAVQDVKESGDINAIFNWNLGGNTSGMDGINKHSQGSANWWAKGIKVVDDKTKRDAAEGVERVVFAADKPYNGMWYRYVLSFPTGANANRMEGNLIASLVGPGGNWLARDAYPTFLVKSNRSPLPFALVSTAQ